jgi:hypothetical protein
LRARTAGARKNVGRAARDRQEETADRPPHYAENHAYRHQAPMTAEKRARGQASAKLVRAELEKVRQEGGAGAYGVFAEERIAAAPARLGRGEEHGCTSGTGSTASTPESCACPGA